MLMSELRDLVMANYNVLVTVAVVGAVSWTITAQLTRARTQRIMNEIDRQKNIIMCQHPDVSKGKKSTDRERGAARSAPDERLRSAFGVNNIFTTRDAGRAKEFKNQAINKLKTVLDITDGPKDRDANWRPLIDDIKQTAGAEFVGTQTSLNLTKVIQYVTLKMSLKYLFP